MPESEFRPACSQTRAQWSNWARNRVVILIGSDGLQVPSAKFEHVVREATHAARHESQQFGFMQRGCPQVRYSERPFGRSRLCCEQRRRTWLFACGRSRSQDGPCIAATIAPAFVGTVEWKHGKEQGHSLVPTLVTLAVRRSILTHAEMTTVCLHCYLEGMVEKARSGGLRIQACLKLLGVDY